MFKEWEIYKDKLDLKESKKQELDNLFSQRSKEICLSKKFYEKSHLINFIEENYHLFLTVSLPNFLEKNKKIYLCTIYNKKDHKNYLYYLNIKKPHITDCTYVNEKRNVVSLSNQAAIEKSLTRELDLKAIAYITEQEEKSEEETIITSSKKEISLTKIPLLTNSRYDKYRAEDPDYYAFLIKGVYRILYNVLTTSEGTSNRYEKTANEISVKLPKVQKEGLQYLQLTMKRANLNSYVSFGYMTNQKKVYSVHLILKLLGYETESLKNYFWNIFKEYDLPLTNLTKYYLLLDTESALSRSQMVKSLVDALTPKALKTWLYGKVSEEEFTKYTLDAEDPLTLDLLLSYLDEKFIQDVNLKNENLSVEEYRKRKIIKILEKLKDMILLDNDVLKERITDHLGDKKLLTYDDHMQVAFSNSFNKWVEKIQMLALKEMAAIKKSKTVSSLIRPELMSKEIQKYLTQQLQGKSGSSVEAYTEALSATNHFELYALQRRVISSLNKESLNVNYRSVTPMKVGRICVVDTPNSRAVGMAEKLALGATTSLQTNESLLKPLYKSIDLTEENKNKLLVMFNNNFLGYSKISYDKLCEKLKPLKNKYGLSIYLDKIRKNTVEVKSTAGRILKPFFNVTNKKVLFDSYTESELAELSIEELVQKNVISFLDVDEEINSFVALNRKDITTETQYLVLCPNAYLSYGTNYLLFCNNNAAHRTTLALRLLKQGLGRQKKDLYTNSRIKNEYLINPTYSLVESPFENLYKDVLGVNAITAFYAGQNEEDCIYCNKTAIERGLFNYSIAKKTSYVIDYDLEKEQYIHQTCADSSAEGGLDYDGTVSKGFHKKGSLVMALKDSKETNSKDQIKNCHLEQNNTYINEVNLEYDKVDALKISYFFNKLHHLHTGDKFGTKTGLKGVVGSLQNEIDLPLSKSGTVPSVYFSSHVINARMTLGPLLEILLSKSAVVKGSPWSFRALEEKSYLQLILQISRNLLKEQNLNSSGYEVFYDPEISSEVNLYCGPTKFFLLEQHALEKYYARGKSGSYNYLTRQPSEGKRVKGGLRFGSMESEACFEQSATNFVKDRMNIDLVSVKVCKNCKIMTHQLSLANDFCYLCKSKETIRLIDLPYPFVLLTKILKACHIETLFEIKDWENAEVDSVSFSKKIPGEALEVLENQGLLEKLMKYITPEEDPSQDKDELDQFEDINEEEEELNTNLEQDKFNIE